MSYFSLARCGCVLTWALLVFAGCQTKEVPGRVGAGGSSGSNVARTDGPQGISDGGLSPPETCLAAGAPRRAPGQACACPGDCTTGTCQQGVCCSGAACGAKRASGSVCDEPGDCESGFCSDGVCCNVACTGACVSCNQADHMGECIPAPAGARDPHNICREDAPETCGQSGYCNGLGGCTKYAAGTVCKLGACDGAARFVPPSVCDGDGTCQAGVAVSCEPSTCENGSCVTACRDSSQCMAPAACTGGSCGKRGNGQDCTAADQCQSGTCVEGVCCESACAGPCQTCALPSARGKCTPVRANAPDPKGMCRDMGAASCGDNGRCNGMGGCQKYPNGTVCQPARCDAAANAETPAGTCQAGQCAVPAGRSCAPHRGCSGSGCASSCGSDSQCTAGNSCVMGSCGKRPNGAVCSAGSQCASGQCAQGRCCASACSGSCRSCALPGQEGTCANVPAGGADPAGMCTAGACTNGCDGSGGCQREPVGSSCGAARCGGGDSRVLRVCDASGACVDRAEACPPSAPNCRDMGICRGNNCTASNCPGPCRVCVMDQCVDAPSSTGCPGGRCSGGMCTPTCTPETCTGNRAECQGGSCVGTCSASNCAGPCRTCSADNRSCSEAPNESPCPGGVCRDGACMAGADCRVSDWGNWSECSRTCGGGTQTRSRTVLQQPGNGGMACPELMETRACNTDPCPMPVDCEVSPWSEWSECTRMCGGGMQTRTRTVTRPASNGGMACPELMETRACNTDPCPMPVDCEVSPWSEWSECTRMCGGGTRMRTRTVTRPASNGGMECPALGETQACNTDPCPECQSGQKSCADMDTRRECVEGAWRSVDCGGETPVCSDGDCVAAPPPAPPP